MCVVGHHRRWALVATLLLVLLPGRASAAPAAEGEEATEPDRDHDGVSDVEETRLGLDPDVVNIPEPLLFDMVRGLGARKGELELNTLVHGSPTDLSTASAGPEMEYVFAHGHAIEVELPLNRSGVEAWKAALQGTLPGPSNAPFLHGWLLMGDYALGTPGARTTALYLAAYRFSARWSALTMTGMRASWRRQGRSRLAGVFNPSVYYEASSTLTCGLEVDSLREVDGTTDLVLLPQIHWQASRSWKVQLGSGAHVDEAGATLLSSLRLSYTY